MQPSQPAPPSSPPPPDVAPVQGRPSGVTIADAPLPLEGLPRTAQDVEGLRVRRDMLRDQLSRANNRRENIANELNRTGNDEVRAGIRQRLAQVDERILQIEREQALTERLLTNAPPGVLAATSRQEEPQNGGWDDESATGLGFGMFGLGIVVTLIAGRVRARLRRRAGLQPQSSALGAPDDPRIERLAQAVDAIAVEVERIGEGQRFVTRLLAEQGDRATLPR